jgi:ABC-type uncharacterized transport system permease subunit
VNLAAILSFHVSAFMQVVAATLFFVELARPDATFASARWAARALVVGVVFAVVQLFAGVLGGTATAWSLKFALSLCACSLSTAYLVLRSRMRIDAVGVIVAPLSLALLIGAQFLRSSGPVTDFPRTLLLMHVAANILGVGLFLLAGAAGAFYLFQERRLKAKRVNALQGRLPALDALDVTEHRLLLAGFPLLTFGIVSGAFFASRLDVMTVASIARTALAYATWLLVAGVLVLRAVAGWSGRRAAYGTLAGVLCVLLVIGIYVAHSGSGGGL